MRRPKKAKKEGTTTFGLRAERRNGWAGAPCSGYYSLVEYTSDDRTEQINDPSCFKILQRALGELPAFGSEFEVTVTVRVTKTGKASTKKCHNPWPSHRCRP